MAETIQTSESRAQTAKARIQNKTDSWLANMKSIENEVKAMEEWYKGETGPALVRLYQRCQKEAKNNIERFIAEYNETIDKSVYTLLDADTANGKNIDGM